MSRSPLFLRDQTSAPAQTLSLTQNKSPNITWFLVKQSYQFLTSETTKPEKRSEQQTAARIQAKASPNLGQP